MFNLFRKGFYFAADAGGGGAGGSGTDDGSGKDAGGAGSGDGGDPVVTFKQSELDKSYAERAKRAAEKAQRDLLEALGVKSLDELKTTITEAAKLRAATLSDAEKAQAAVKASETVIAALEREKAQMASDAQKREIRHAVELAAMEMGFQSPKDAYSLADLAGVKVDEGGKVDGVDNALKELVKAKPYLVETGGTSTSNTNARDRGTGSGPNKEELVRRKRADAGYSGI